MADPSARDRAIEDIAARVFRESHASSRPGQCESLEEIARDLRALIGDDTDGAGTATPADTAALLRAAAAGRREYAGPKRDDGDGNIRLNEMRDALMAEAATLEMAAQVAEGNYRPLYGWLPSWRWTPEMDRLVLSDAGDSIAEADVAALAARTPGEPRERQDGDDEHRDTLWGVRWPEDGVVRFTGSEDDAREFLRARPDVNGELVRRTVTAITEPWRSAGNAHDQFCDGTCKNAGTGGYVCPKQLPAVSGTMGP